MQLKQIDFIIRVQVLIGINKLKAGNEEYSS